jgi:hypothetical protein
MSAFFRAFTKTDTDTKESEQREMRGPNTICAHGRTTDARSSRHGGQQSATNRSPRAAAAARTALCAAGAAGAAHGRTRATGAPPRDIAALVRRPVISRSQRARRPPRRPRRRSPAGALARPWKSRATAAFQLRASDGRRSERSVSCVQAHDRWHRKAQASARERASAGEEDALRRAC